jgi:hypothetical protein
MTEEFEILEDDYVAPPPKRKDERAPRKPRIYEVVVETYRYNQTGRTRNYRGVIKYPGWAEFFGEDDG